MIEKFRDLFPYDHGKTYRLVVLFTFTMLLLGVGFVALEIDSQLDKSISNTEEIVEKEVEDVWQQVKKAANQRSFLSHLSFNVNLAAMDALEEPLRSLKISPNLFVYDSDQHYFGKTNVTSLDRFSFSILERSLGDRDFRWQYMEHQGRRYIQRFSKIENDGIELGVLRLILSLDDIQRKVLMGSSSRTHLSTENENYDYVRCRLNSATDLLVCIPVDFNTIMAISGNTIYFLILAWFVLLGFLLIYLRSRLAQARAQVLVELSSQVSHDIQSPLLALKVATKDLMNVPENQRLMIQRSIERIEDIVNDLKNKRDRNLGVGSRASAHLLYGLVSSILSEKRLQYKYRDIEIDLYVAEDVQEVFVKLNQQEFKRVLSNIINNAVESIDGHGNVGIEIERRADVVVLSVIDTGCGISEETQQRLFEKGVSIGKKEGQGLGLYHARKSAQEWGGNIRLESLKGEGTKVLVSLPVSERPSWFTGKLSLEPEQDIVIIDDDQNIHEMWKARFSDLGIQNKVHSFYHLESAQREVLNLNSQYAIFLVDFELIHSRSNGIEFILRNQIQGSSVLVSSRYDDERVLTMCSQYGIGMLPKILMNSYDLFQLGYRRKEPSTIVIGSIVNENIAASNSFEGIEKTKESSLWLKTRVLIDDDPLVRKIWKMSAGANKESFLSFKSAEDFMAEANNVPKDAEIFIDVDLGSVRGDQWSKEVYDLGFENIKITTGFDDLDLSNMPWIKGKISKAPPF
ncbi:MAG: hybrid sensor histidine kinase/response regulator [Bdellovibrionota bacterium]|nr:hybrid sensor histidine kinase/response regulator [Bdellovibrionota bacterium]